MNNKYYNNVLSNESFALYVFVPNILAILYTRLQKVGIWMYGSPSRAI